MLLVRRDVRKRPDLQIDHNNAPDVIEESQEIADDFDIACAACAVRFEISGDDPDMKLFNDYLLVVEKLEATGSFYIFDQSEEELFDA